MRACVQSLVRAKYGKLADQYTIVLEKENRNKKYRSDANWEKQEWNEMMEVEKLVTLWHSAFLMSCSSQTCKPEEQRKSLESVTSVAYWIGDHAYRKQKGPGAILHSGWPVRGWPWQQGGVRGKEVIRLPVTEQIWPHVGSLVIRETNSETYPLRYPFDKLS